MPHQHRMVAADEILDFTMDSSNRHGTIIGVASTLYSDPNSHVKWKDANMSARTKVRRGSDDNLD